MGARLCRSTVISNSHRITTQGESVANINGREYKGRDITVFIDGRLADKFITERRDISIQFFETHAKSIKYISTGSIDLNLKGYVHRVTSNSGDITIRGSAGGNVKTNSGEIIIEGRVGGDVNTNSGDVTCGDTRNVKTVSGDVKCKRVNGNVSTVSGDVRR